MKTIKDIIQNSVGESLTREMDDLEHYQATGRWPLNQKPEWIIELEKDLGEILQGDDPRIAVQAYRAEVKTLQEVTDALQVATTKLHDMAQRLIWNRGAADES